MKCYEIIDDYLTDIEAEYEELLEKFVLEAIKEENTVVIVKKVIKGQVLQVSLEKFKHLDEKTRTIAYECGYEIFDVSCVPEHFIETLKKKYSEV